MSVADLGEGPGIPGLPPPLFWVKSKKGEKGENPAGQVNQNRPLSSRFELRHCMQCVLYLIYRRMLTILRMRLEQIGFVLKRIVPQVESRVTGNKLLHIARESFSIKLVCTNLYALFSHVRKGYAANENCVQLFHM